MIRWLKIMHGNNCGADDDELLTYCAAGLICNTRHEECANEIQLINLNLVSTT